MKSTIKIEKLVSRLKAEKHKAVAVTELGNLFSAVRVYQECKKAEIKPILGCTFFIKDGDTLSNLTVLSKNLNGWKGLIKAVSHSNLPENVIPNKKIPTITLEKLSEFIKGNSIVYSGSINSHLSKLLWTNYKDAIKSRDYNKTKELLKPGWQQIVKNVLDGYKQLFGDVYLERCVSNKSVECVQVINEIVEWASSELQVPKIGTSNVCYLNKEDAEDQRILLCSGEQSNLQDIETQIEFNEDYDDLLFFRSSTSYLPLQNEINNLFTQDEIENTQKIVDMCETYDILGKPKIPNFQCPDNMNYDDYLRHLCREGWKQKIVGKIPETQIDQYATRIKYELDVMKEAGLAGYFIVVADIVNWAKNHGWLVGERGSVGGSMIAYLTNITDIDPIEHDLLFERFYNVGRKGSLPDIDMDFPIFKREEVVKYIRDKYGSDFVAQMATFGRFQGREALKTVLRVKQRCSYEEMNRITQFVPDESKISDELQEMKDLGIEPTIIKWALENNSEELKQWAFYDDNGQLQGEYAKDFEQAMRLEGLKRQQGRHASGYVISNIPLQDFCPLLYDDKSGEHIIGADMQSAEAMGCLKVDVLGSAVLDNIMDAINIINFGDTADEI